jgi:hypothetical protein
MDDLEQSLRAALARVPAPAGLAERILALIGAGPMRKTRWWRTTALRWALAAALLAAMAAGGVIAYQRQQRARGERARRQVMLALRITGARLHAVQAQIVRLDGTRGESR